MKTFESKNKLDIALILHEKIQEEFKSSLKYHDIVEDRSKNQTINSLINYKEGTYRGVSMTIEISKLSFTSGNLVCFKMNYQYNFGDISQRTAFVYTPEEKSDFDKSISFLIDQIHKTIKTFEF